MIAKRYTGLLLDTLPHDAPNQDTEYVLASDYDRMLALGETYERDCKRLLVVGTRQKARIARLEAALTKFLVWNGTDYPDGRTPAVHGDATTIDGGAQADAQTHF